MTKDTETVFVWDAQSGRQLAEFAGHGGAVCGAAFSADATQLVTCSLDGTARVSSVLNPAGAPVLIDHKLRVSACAIHPDGGQIATVTTDGHGRILDARSGEKIADLASDELPIGPIRYVAGGRLLLTQPGEVRGISFRLYLKPGDLWDAKTGSHVANLHGEVTVNRPDHEFLVASEERGFSGLRIWGGDDVQQIVAIGEAPVPVVRARAIAMSADGVNIAAAFDNIVVLWSRHGPGVVAEIATDATGARFHPDGRRVLTWSFEPTADIWDIDQNRLYCKLEGHSDRINIAAFSPDGRRVVTAAQDATARLWKADGACGSIQELKGHTREVRDAVFSPDGRTIATASADRTVRFWNGSTGEESAPAIEGFDGPVNRVLFSLDGSFVAAKTSGDDDVRIWEAASHKEITSADRERLSTSFEQEFEEGDRRERRSPDRRLVMKHSVEVAISDARSGAVIARFRGGPNGDIYDARFNADGSRVLILFRSMVRVAQVR